MKQLKVRNISKTNYIVNNTKVKAKSYKEAIEHYASVMMCGSKVIFPGKQHDIHR